MTGQVWNLDPGQNQKPRVVGQELEIVLSCVSIPADKVIPQSTLPGRRAKQKTGQWIMPPVKNHIFHIFSHRTAQTQVMLPGKQTLEETKEGRCL